MLIHGKCHCGNIAFALDWPGVTSEVPARACGCAFCVKHGGVWASNPNAKLSITHQNKDAVSRYTFGTGTATFHVCSRCGAVPIVTSEIASRLYAVVNVNTFEDFDSPVYVSKRRILMARKKNHVSRVDKGTGLLMFTYPRGEASRGI